MKLTDFLQDVGRPIAFYPSLRKITGSTNATIFLCQLIYWKGKESDPDGWIYKTSEEMEKETGLSYDEQKTARTKLKEAGLIDEHYARLDHQMRFKLNENAIDSAWDKPVPESRNPMFGKADSPYSLNSNTENTTENNKDSEIRQTNTEQPPYGTAYNRGEQERPDKIKEYLGMMNFVGAKIEVKVDATLSYLAETLTRNTHTKEWREFAKYIVKMQKDKGWNVEVFTKWLMGQKGYDPQYWSVKKMTEFYPQAFEATQPKQEVNTHTDEKGLPLT